MPRGNPNCIKGGESINPNGRPKGARNKTNSLARENVIAVFNKVGGVEGMAAWALEHKTDFYKIYGRLIPVEVNANHEGGMAITLSWGTPQPRCDSPDEGSDESQEEA